MSSHLSLFSMSKFGPFIPSRRVLNFLCGLTVSVFFFLLVLLQGQLYASTGGEGTHELEMINIWFPSAIYKASVKAARQKDAQSGVGVVWDGEGRDNWTWCWIQMQPAVTNKGVRSEDPTRGRQGVWKVPMRTF